MRSKKGFLKEVFNRIFFTARADMNTVVTDDANNGLIVMPNHVRLVYSKEIEFKALPIMRWVQFAKVKTELGVEPGLTIRMMTYNNVIMGGALTEGTRMQTRTMSSTMSQISVGERGNAISVSELALKSAFTDLMADATTLLGRDMALVLDCELRDTFFAGIGNTLFGRENKDAAKIANRAAIDTSNFFSTTVIKDAVEVLATNNCPKFEGSYYISMVHPYVGAQVA